MSYPETSETRQGRRSSSRGHGWSRRLARWPLIRLLVESRAFRFVVLVFLLVAITAPLMVLKLWRITPPNDPKPTRISTLDYIQAWSLKRKAREAFGRADMQNALFAWRAAAANNPSDLEALRGGLQAIQRSTAPPELASTALSMGAWLLRQGRTNLADLELIGSVWNRCELHERTAAVLSNEAGKTSPALNRLRAIAYFRSGRMAPFRELVKQDPELDRLMRATTGPDRSPAAGAPPDREFTLTSLAYLAGWGAEEDRPEALKRLEAAAAVAPDDLLVNEMLMAARVQLRDLPGCEQVFQQLQASGRVGIQHLTAYCMLLAQEGRKEEGKRVFREANPVPKTDAEVLRLIAAQRALEMYEEADTLCRTYFSDPPWLEQGALIRTDLLERLKRWDELRRLAYRIRNYPTLVEAMGGYSYFIEGLAELNEGYRGNADEAFRRAVEKGFPDPRLGFRVASSLLKLEGAKYGEYAEGLLLNPRVQKAFTNDVDYLVKLMQCAIVRKRDDYLWTVVTNLYALSPKDPMVVNNYAACLLLFRRKPEEAIVHTLRLLQAYPNVPETIINHGVALTMNGRLEEADGLLERVLPDRLLDLNVRSQYYLALFELRLLQGRKEEARQALRAVDTTNLLPVQIQWLEENAPLAEESPAQPAGAAP